MNIPVPGSLKDAQGRFIVAALFDWELADELAGPAADDGRRDALRREARYRGLELAEGPRGTGGVPLE